MNYKTNSITLGGGESLDVILDASDPKLPGGQSSISTPPTSITSPTTQRTSAV